ncbi:hypothetical protein [Desulfovibrio sp. ZJ369]|uniref:hypothetical protein n=1 Tax=Desulfovibrio sp. ZJ369 TaxID=2709793 RepID=UPI0013EBBDCC|nr:hypothetical protein [Desulfovibrio sp. ZJ369]
MSLAAIDSSDKRFFRQNETLKRTAAQKQYALEHFAFEIIQFQKRRCHHFASRARSGRSFGAGAS